jgi:hypothetical protein
MLGCLAPIVPVMLMGYVQDDKNWLQDEYAGRAATLRALRLH